MAGRQEQDQVAVQECTHFCHQHPLLGKTKEEKIMLKRELKMQLQASRRAAGNAPTAAAPVQFVDGVYRPPPCLHSCPIHPQRTDADWANVFKRQKRKHDKTVAKREQLRAEGRPLFPLPPPGKSPSGIQNWNKRQRAKIAREIRAREAAAANAPRVPAGPRVNGPHDNGFRANGPRIAAANARAGPRANGPRANGPRVAAANAAAGPRANGSRANGPRANGPRVAAAGLRANGSRANGLRANGPRVAAAGAPFPYF